MKTLFILAILCSTSTMAETMIVVEGRGRNWGNIAEDDAKNNALQLAKEKCNGEAEQIGEWDVQILNRKEGMFYVSAISQFKCL